MNDRLKTIYSEILEKCDNSNCFEFEYYWEIWGVTWYPWTLEINVQSESFSLSDISYKDLDNLSKNGLIELIKEYPKEEMDGEFDRKRYRIIKAKGL